MGKRPYRLPTVFIRSITSGIAKANGPYGLFIIMLVPLLPSPSELWLDPLTYLNPDPPDRPLTPKLTLDFLVFMLFDFTRH